MSTTRYHCNSCGFVTKTNALLSNHNATCKKDSEAKLLKTRSTYQRYNDWFQNAIDNNQCPSIDTLRAQYRLMSGAILKLFRMLMTDIPEAEHAALLKLKDEYEDKLTNNYTELLNRNADRGKRTAIIDSFINDRPMSMHSSSHSLIESETQSICSSFGNTPKNINRTTFDHIENIIPPPPVSRLAAIRASRRSVGSMIGHLQ